MESKYYTPTEDEFYPGFEYEVKDTRYEYEVEKISDTKLKVISDPISTTDWFKETYTGKDFMYIEDGSILRCNLTKYIYDEDVRVKCLDVNDIITIGFIEENIELYKTDTKYSKFNKCFTKFSTNSDGRSYGATLFFDNIMDASYIKIEGEIAPGAVFGHLGSIMFKGNIKNKSELIKLLKQLNINE